MRINRVGWLPLLWACTSTAWAHHGGGTFDMSKCLVFHGTVRQFAWLNPHAWIYVTVPKADGANELWGFELGSVGVLSRMGFRPVDFPKGNDVVVTAHINRDESKHTGSASTVVLPDGRTVKNGFGGPGAGNASAACRDYK